MKLSLTIFWGLLTVALLSQNATAEEERKLVHKPLPPIDMNPPRTSERNTHDSDRGSEQMHQAPEDVFELTGLAGFSNKKTSYDSSAAPKTSSQETIAKENLGAEYGLTREVSVGGELQYNSGWTAVSPTSAASNQHSFGLSDPSLYAKGRIDFESSSFRYGGRLNFSLAKKYGDSNGNSNFYSGGLSIAPLVGYEYYVSEHTFGAKLSYQAFIGNRSETLLSSSAEATVDLSGGNLLSPTFFYEYDYFPMKIGLDFAIVFRDATSVTFAGIDVDSRSSSVNYMFDAYIPILLAESFTLIPRASAGWSGSSGSVSSTSGWSTGLAARYAF